MDLCKKLSVLAFLQDKKTSSFIYPELFSLNSFCIVIAN